MSTSSSTASTRPVAQPDLRRVHDGLAVADAVRAQLADPVEDVQVDRLELRGRCQVAALDLDAVVALGAAGHIAEIRVEEGAWSLTARVDGPAQPTIDTDGNPEDELSGTEIADLNRAVGRSSAVEALRVAPRLVCAVRIVIRNDPRVSGAHWIHRSRELERLLASQRWHATAATLATGPRIFVIGDAGATALATGGLSVRGPDGSDSDEPTLTLDDMAYRHLRRQDRRPDLPSPAVFACVDSTGVADSTLTSLVSRFNGVARCLIWYWRAAEAQIQDTGRVNVTFLGARTVTFTLEPVATPSVQADLALYTWASTGNDLLTVVHFAVVGFVDFVDGKWAVRRQSDGVLVTVAGFVGTVTAELIKPVAGGRHSDGRFRAVWPLGGPVFR